MKLVHNGLATSDRESPHPLGWVIQNMETSKVTRIWRDGDSCTTPGVNVKGGADVETVWHLDSILKPGNPTPGHRPKRKEN